MQNIAAIVYTSNTGFTKRYAQLLGHAAAIPVYDLEDGTSAPAAGADIVYLGWLSAGTVKGLAKARRRWNVRAVCAVGMAPEGPDTLGRLTEHNDVGARPVFYLRGGYAPEKLTGAYKLMMGAMARIVNKKPAKDEGEHEMQQAFLTGGDWVAETSLEPVLAWLRTKTEP